MSTLAWKYKAWGGRFPSIKTDEFSRQTLVIPNPFSAAESDDEGIKYYPAVVLVIAPWWLCRSFLDPEYRETVRRERQVAKRDSQALEFEIEQAQPNS